MDVSGVELVYVAEVGDCFRGVVVQVGWMLVRIMEMDRFV